MAANDNIRVRLAPSPTGEVHIGTIWLGLFDWIFAQQHHGSFILRVEDTDQKRLVPGTMDRLAQALEWYGLTADEGPTQGGEYGPYTQSQRLPLYHEHAQKLIEQGQAYYCFCSPQRLDEVRATQQAAKLPPRYDKRCATIPVTEAKARVSGGEPAVIRLNMPTTGTVTLNDLVRGQVTFRFDQIDDSVLMKSDGWPTYHLAVVVDDHLMNISHVIRAEEWLSSTPKHLFLYQAFDWTPPQFAHLPQILGANKKKLSKRDGAASALSFRDQGYLPEAMINFLGLMGWHPKGDSEIISRQELVAQFKIEEMNPSGAVFDQAKLDWLNGYYIRQLSLEDFHSRVEKFWHIPNNEKHTQAWLRQALQLVHDRIKKLSEIDGLVNFVFTTTWDALVAEGITTVLTANNSDDIVWIRDWLQQQAEPWSPADLKEKTIAAVAAVGKKNGQVLSPLRQILSLSKASPDVFDILGLLGKKESLRRIDMALELWKR